MTAAGLSDLDIELLELCVSPETTTTLHEEMLESSLERVVESALSDRGLMVTYRGVYAGVHRPRNGVPEERVYEDDWWKLTPAGRQAVQRVAPT